MKLFAVCFFGLAACATAVPTSSPAANGGGSAVVKQHLTGAARIFSTMKKYVSEKFSKSGSKEDAARVQHMAQFIRDPQRYFLDNIESDLFEETNPGNWRHMILQDTRIIFSHGTFLRKLLEQLVQDEHVTIDIFTGVQKSWLKKNCRAQYRDGEVESGAGIPEGPTLHPKKSLLDNLIGNGAVIHITVEGKKGDWYFVRHYPSKANFLDKAAGWGEYIQRRATDPTIGEELVDGECLDHFNTAWLAQWGHTSAFNRVSADETGTILASDHDAAQRATVPFYDVFESAAAVDVSCLGRTHATAVTLWHVLYEGEMPVVNEIDDVQELGAWYDPTNACPGKITQEQSQLRGGGGAAAVDIGDNRNAHGELPPPLPPFSGRMEYEARGGRREIDREKSGKASARWKAVNALRRQTTFKNKYHKS